tara:strand:+ start:2198 stop:3349 length:1152 start_codon:yes stop_codon:yes gene_type:complete
MKKIALVVGTRPEAIKLAPVYHALAESSKFRPVLLSTGQHREMLHQALSAFDIQPDFDLDLMTKGQSLAQITSRVIGAVSQFLQESSPAAVLVQGDTTTVLAASISAFYERIPLGHIEAGLRTHNMNSPWPEEMNRRLVSPIAKWNFAPTEGSRSNLLKEAIDASSIHVTGNTVIDSLLFIRDRIRTTDIDESLLCKRLGIPNEFHSEFMANPARKWLLVTGHRRESFGSGFENICQALIQLTEAHPDLGILYPVHLNPNVQEPVNRILNKNPQIALIEPAGYEDFVWLLDHCHFVMSDSGGVQEEAPSLGKPVLVLRENTERPEAVSAGTCRLVGTDSESICREAEVLLNDPSEYARRSTLVNPYGDGKASGRILNILEDSL